MGQTARRPSCSKPAKMPPQTRCCREGHEKRRRKKKKTSDDRWGSKPKCTARQLAATSAGEVKETYLWPHYRKIQNIQNVYGRLKVTKQDLASSLFNFSSQIIFSTPSLLLFLKTYLRPSISLPPLLRTSSLRIRLHQCTLSAKTVAWIMSSSHY